MRLLTVTSFYILGECNCIAQWQANDLTNGLCIQWGVYKLEKFVRDAPFSGGSVIGDPVFPVNIPQSLTEGTWLSALCSTAPKLFTHGRAPAGAQ